MDVLGRFVFCAAGAKNGLRRYAILLVFAVFSKLFLLRWIYVKVDHRMLEECSSEVA